MPWIMHSYCIHCRGECWYQESPTGGWWIHETKPETEHDAQGQPEDQGEIEELTIITDDGHLEIRHGEHKHANW
jgi:hypothetical protein